MEYGNIDIQTIYEKINFYQHKQNLHNYWTEKSILYWYIYHRWAIFDHLENIFFLIQRYLISFWHNKVASGDSHSNILLIDIIIKQLINAKKDVQLKLFICESVHSSLKPVPRRTEGDRRQMSGCSCVCGERRDTRLPAPRWWLQPSQTAMDKYVHILS